MRRSVKNKEMLIVDGYNLLHQLPKLKGKKIDKAREILVRKLEEKKRTFQEILVVFDESADDYIKRQVKRSRTPRKITVVTDDREIRDFVKLYESSVLSTKEMREILFPEKTIPSPPIDEKPSPSSEKGKRISEELKRVWRI